MCCATPPWSPTGPRPSFRIPIPEPWAGALRRAAIGHDLGKPDARQEDVDAKKARFTGHPSWSVLRALEWLQEQGELDEMHAAGTLYPTLAAIALHDAALNDLYTGAAASKGRERWARVLAYNPDLAWLLPALNLADDLGRMRGEGDVKQPDPCFADLALRAESVPSRPAFDPGGDPLAAVAEQPTLVVMVGLPGSGKSTLARNLAEIAGESETCATGLDPAVHALARERGITYADVHADPALMAQADERARAELIERLADSPPRLVIADKTHSGVKSRSRTLAFWDQALNQARKRQSSLPAYRVVALQVLTPYDLALQRSLSRPHQSVSEAVIREMIFRFTPPVYGEGTASGRNLSPWVYDGILYALNGRDRLPAQVGVYAPHPAVGFKRLLDQPAVQGFGELPQGRNGGGASYNPVKNYPALFVACIRQPIGPGDGSDGQPISPSRRRECSLFALP